MSRTKVYIANENKNTKLPTGLKLLIRRACIATLRYENFEPDAEFSVTFVSDKKIRELNSQYRGKDTSTDVLSFPMYEKEEIPHIKNIDNELVVLGDIVISSETAIHQSIIYNHSVEREICFLVVHSVLHLLGYDHEKSKFDESEMFRKQEEILTALGIIRD